MADPTPGVDRLAGERATSPADRGLAPPATRASARPVTTTAAPPSTSANAPQAPSASASTPSNAPSTRSVNAGRLQFPQDEYLQKASVAITQRLVYDPITKLSQSDLMQARWVLGTLQRITPPLTPTTLNKLLHDLSLRQNALSEVFRLSEYEGLGAYLVSLGVSSAELQAFWSFDASKALQLLGGIGVGILAELGMNYLEAAVIGVIVGALSAAWTFMTPTIAALFTVGAITATDTASIKRIFKAIEGVLSAAWSLLKSGNAVPTFLEYLRKDAEAHLLANRFGEAGQALGRLAVQMFFAKALLTDITKIAARIAPRLRQLGKRVALNYELFKLAAEIHTPAMSGVAEGWEFVRLAEKRLMVRRADIGAFTVEERELEEWVLEQRRAAPTAATASSPTPTPKPATSSPSAARPPARAANPRGSADRGVTSQNRSVDPASAPPHRPRLGRSLVGPVTTFEISGQRVSSYSNEYFLGNNPVKYRSDLETVLNAQPNSPLSRALLENGKLRRSPLGSRRPAWQAEPRWIETGHTLSGKAGHEDVLFVQTKAFNQQWSADLERTGYVQAEFALIIDRVAVHPRTAWELVDRGYLERAVVEGARKVPLVE